MEVDSPQAGPSRPRRPSDTERDRAAISPRDIQYVPYETEEAHLPAIMDLCDQELSEPYSIYTFRYFLQEWPHLAFLAYPPSPPSTTLNSSSADPHIPIACIICKQESHRGKRSRGYIAMLTVDKRWRRKGIAKRLVMIAMEEMIHRGADEIVLETEYDNQPSLSLYTSLGFFKEKRLSRFYMNGKDAFRLVLPIPQNISFSFFPPETPSEASEAREALSSDGCFDGGGGGGGSGGEMDTDGNGLVPPVPEEMDMAGMIDGYGGGGSGSGSGIQKNGSASEMEQAVRISAGLAGIVI